MPRGELFVDNSAAGPDPVLAESGAQRGGEETPDYICKSEPRIGAVAALTVTACPIPAERNVADPITSSHNEEMVKAFVRTMPARAIVPLGESSRGNSSAYRSRMR
jgi:hypothetical protein